MTDTTRDNEEAEAFVRGHRFSTTRGDPSFAAAVESYLHGKMAGRAEVARERDEALAAHERCAGVRDAAITENARLLARIEAMEADEDETREELSLLLNKIDTARHVLAGAERGVQVRAAARAKRAEDARKEVKR